MPARRRTNFPKDVRDQALARADGQCEAALPSGERCPNELRAGFYEFAHLRADALLGPATLENCGVWCRPCHRAEFPGLMKVVAKARRQEAYHVGLACTRRPMPGGTHDPRSRGLDGLTRDRDTGEVLSRSSSVDVRAL